jgi:hypothetical protein
MSGRDCIGGVFSLAWRDPQTWWRLSTLNALTFLGATAAILAVPTLGLGGQILYMPAWIAIGGVVAPVVLAACVALHVRRQEAIDRQCNVNEEG